MRLIPTRTIRQQQQFLLFALGLPFLAFLVIASVNDARHDREAAGQQMLGVARLTAARLDDHIGDLAQILSLLCVAVGTSAADVERNDALLLSLTGRLPPEVNNIAVWTPQGDNIGVLSPRLRQTAFNVTDTGFFRNALASPHLVLEAPMTSPTNQQVVGIFAQRIERQGKVAGVVAVAVHLRKLQSLIAPETDNPAGRVITVTSSDGVVLARSIDPEKWVGKNLLHGGGDVARSLQQREGVRDGPSADGIDRIAGFTMASRAPWLVYVGLPTDVALAAASRRLHENMAMGVALMLVGLALSAWLARRIASPLIELERDARVFAQGDLSHRSSAKGAQEISSLSATLNQMAAALQQRTEHLQASQAEFADLYAHAPCGYHSLDAQGRYLRVNDTELGWLGCPREDVLGGMSMQDFLTDEGRALFAQKFPLLMAEGRLDEIEFDLVGRTGQTRRVVCSATCIHGPDGSFLATRTVLFDISELQQLREDLRSLTREQQAMLDTDLIGIVKLKHQHLIWANAGVERMLGYAPTELIGKPSRTVYADDETHERVGRQAHPILSTGQSFRAQLQLARKNGQRIWVDMLAIELPTHPGETLAMVVDITPLKQAEEMRLRTLALQAENHRLIDSNRIKTLFLANMSHELHTPLNAVIGYAHLLRSGSVAPGTPKFTGYLEKIGGSGTQLLHLIDTMLDFARIESGKLELRPVPVALRRLMDDVAALSEAAAGQKRIALRVHVDADIGEVTVDATRLTQVLSHLVSNAIKFSHPCGEVNLRARLEAPDDFQIDVQDQGIGIAAQDMPRLFTAFQQLSEGHSKDYPGIGLGLALTRKLVEAQAGTITVSTLPGQGSTFSVRLPRAPGRAPRSAETGAGADAGHTPSTA